MLFVNRIPLRVVIYLILAKPGSKWYEVVTLRDPRANPWGRDNSPFA
jgi:hypothetical protein